MSHAIGSYVGADGSSRLRPPSRRLPAMTATAGDTGRPIPLARLPERGGGATEARPRLAGSMDASSPGTRKPLLVDPIRASRPFANAIQTPTPQCLPGRAI